MLETRSVEYENQVQQQRWNSLTPGTIFESSLCTLYLVISRSDSQITAAPLSARARECIIAGRPDLSAQQLHFGDVTIERVFPMPPLSGAELLSAATF